LIRQADRSSVSKMVQAAYTDNGTSAEEFVMNPQAIKGLVKDPSKLQKAMLVSSASPQFDNSGAVSSVVFIGCDLTEISTYKEAEARKCHFMSVVSHELRSPLHGIISIAGTLLDGQPSKHTRKMLTSVSNCASRLLELVTNIMDMASLSAKSGRGQTINLHKDPTELPKLIEEIVLLVSRSVDKRGLPYVTNEVKLINKVAGLPVIEADAHKCTQVFYNLITNACKFTKQGSITMSSRQDPNGQWVEVAVADTGCGMAESNLKHIFEPFEQVDSSRARCAEGVGLGLAIAHEVVQLHGGELRVTSKENIGSTFTVRLPNVMKQAKETVAEDVLDSDTLPEMPPIMPKSITSNSTNSNPSQISDGGLILPKLLSVDDSSVNQQVVAGALAGHYDVAAVMNGQDALVWLETCDALPEVILLDLMMPGMSGIDVCKAVRKKHAKYAMPILFYSACSEQKFMAEAYEAGCNDFIVKPTNKKLLLALLSNVLEPKKYLEGIARG